MFIFTYKRIFIFRFLLNILILKYYKWSLRIIIGPSLCIFYHTRDAQTMHMIYVMYMMHALI